MSVLLKYWQMSKTMWVSSVAKLLFGCSLLTSSFQLTASLDFSKIISVQEEFCNYKPKGQVCPDPVGLIVGQNAIGIPFMEPFNTSVKPPKWPSTSCCKACTCHVDCFRSDNCCPEMVLRYPTVSTRTCKLPQLRPVKSDYPNAFSKYLMITGCSNSRDDVQYNESLKMMCEQAGSYDEVHVKVPVTDDRFVTYVNRYCAICNGVSEQTLVYWKIKLACINDMPGEVTIDTLVEKVNKTVSCNVIFDVPAHLLNDVTPCVDYISSCNVTKHAIFYDTFTEQACQAYDQLYDFRYKNVFCYLCNTDEDIGKATCNPSTHGPDFDESSKTIHVSFSALLRFRPRERFESRGDRDQSDCTSYQLYDKYKNVCRNLTCYPPRVFQNNTCTSPYETIAGVSYRFFLKFEVLTSLEALDIISLQDDIKQYISNIVTDLSLPSTFKITRLLVKANWTDNRDVSSGIPDYYIVQLDVAIPLEYPVSPIFIDKMLAFDNSTQFVKTSLGYDIAFHVFFIIVDLRRIDSSHVYESIQNVTLIDISSRSRGINKKWWEELFDNTTKSDDKKEDTASIITQDDYDSNVTEVVIPTNQCPLVALSSDEFQVSWFHWGVSIEELEVNISRNKYVSNLGKADNNSIYICRKLFQNIIETLLLRYPKRDRHSVQRLQAVLSLVCTYLSVVCSILTLITYTLFLELRTQPGMNNVMLTSSLLCSQILFQFGTGQAHTVPEWLCGTLGILVHFSWLLTLMWMNVCSLHMFRVFRSLKQVPTTGSVAKTTLTYTAYSFIMATIPVVTNIIYSMVSDDNVGYGGRLCYIASYRMVGYLFALPVGIVVIVNLVLFLSVIVTISKLPKVDTNASKTRNFAKIYIKISTLTGITWIFGFVFVFTELEILEYIFIILNASLGVFIFLSFVCNKRVIALYSKIIQPKKLKYSESKQSQSQTQRSALEN